MDDFEHRVHVDSGRVRYPGQEAIARLRAEVESLQAQLQAGESFHAVATQQRDAAWREVEALKLQRTAADLVHRDTSTTVLVQAGEIEELRRSNGALLRTKDALQRELARVRAEVEALRADAEQYRWLRAQHWHDGPMCVVVAPKQSVKLGADCPSEERLDALIYAARAAQGVV